MTRQPTAISERIQQISQDVLQVNQGSLYSALHRVGPAADLRCHLPPQRATAGNVTRLVLWESLRVVGIGLAWSLAAFLMSTPAAAHAGTIVDVFEPLAYAASLLCIVTACAASPETPRAFQHCSP